MATKIRLPAVDEVDGWPRCRWPFIERDPLRLLIERGAQEASQVGCVVPMRVAGGHDLIRVSGARENNLKDMSVGIPKGRLTVFIGGVGVGEEFPGRQHDRRRMTEVDRVECSSRAWVVPFSECSTKALRWPGRR